MTTEKRYPVAEMFEERYGQAKGHQMLVARARRDHTPLYHVRAPSGLTLDMCTSIVEARKVRNQEGRGARIYAQLPTGQTEVTAQ